MMCDALRRLMKPEMEEAIDKAVNEALDDNIRDFAKRMIRSGKCSDTDIVDITALTLLQVEDLRRK